MEPRKELRPLLRSVVKVMATLDPPDYEQPWQTSGPVQQIGSGAIIATSAGLRVLTNAHVVADQVFVEVRRYERAKKYRASVAAVGHDCDLALLAVEDPSFYSGVPVLPFGGLPSLSDTVNVLGYPVGGDRLSVTQGIVSRIELQEYSHSQYRLLTLQIDAAINAGNSGGPVVSDGQLVGIAFQAIEDGDSIGHAIPMPVIRRFLDDVAGGRYRGFLDLGIVTQNLESPTHRKFLGIPEEIEGGVLVCRINPHGSAAAVVGKETPKIEPRDVLLAIGGAAIAADGTIMESELSLDYTQLVADQLASGVDVDLWRAGAGGRIRTHVPLRPPAPLVPGDQYDVRPSYLIYGGLLFAPLTRNLLRVFGENWFSDAPRELVALYETGMPDIDRKQVIVLQKVLPDKVNVGYHDLQWLVLQSVNGVIPSDMRHLKQLIALSDVTLCFTSTAGHEIVIDKKLAESRRRHVLEQFGAPADASPDLIK